MAEPTIRHEGLHVILIEAQASAGVDKIAATDRSLDAFQPAGKAVTLRCQDARRGR